jgi:hypothetical protein
MAARDLTATLQLLVERAQYITGASGAAIALRTVDGFICRASAGPSAPASGSRVEIGSGLCGECVRARQTLCCNDTSNDPRVNQESCRALSIASAVMMPLLRQSEVAGVFELLSDRINAFEERDLLALERMGEMIQTAIDHAEAAERAQSVIAVGPPSAGNGTAAHESPVGTRQGGLAGSVERGNIGRCSACGFPVSEGRTLCLDCTNAIAPEAALASPVPHPAAPAVGPVFDFGLGEETWLQSHKYLIGTVVAAVLTVTAVILLR